MFLRRFILIGICSFCLVVSQAQSLGMLDSNAVNLSNNNSKDTTSLTLPQAEQIFLNKNLSLLAARYNISIAKAAVVQANLYYNPNFTFTSALYAPATNRWFDINSSRGEFAIFLTQQIILAGKRNKAVQIAKNATTLTEYQFYDLLRTLRYQLRSQFYNAYFIQQSINAYLEQVTTLKSLSESYDKELPLQHVTLKETIRIKALYYGIEASITDLHNQLEVAESQMRLFLQDTNSNAYYVFEANDSDIFTSKPATYSYAQLLDSAMQYRYDLKALQLNQVIDKEQIAYQKALAIPNLTLGYQFDELQGYVPNSSTVTASMDIPVFNRNQGAILSARLQQEQDKINLQQQYITMENDIQQSYNKLINSDKAVQLYDTTYINQFNRLLNGINENFKKRNVNLIDFTDFNESYSSNLLQLYNLRNAKIQAAEELNFYIGRTFYNN